MQAQQGGGGLAERTEFYTKLRGRRDLAWPASRPKLGQAANTVGQIKLTVTSSSPGTGEHFSTKAKLPPQDFSEPRFSKAVKEFAALHALGGKESLQACSEC